MLTRVYETSFMPVIPRYINVHNQVCETDENETVNCLRAWIEV